MQTLQNNLDLVLLSLLGVVVVLFLLYRKSRKKSTQIIDVDEFADTKVVEDIYAQELSINQNEIIEVESESGESSEEEDVSHQNISEEKSQEEVLEESTKKTEKQSKQDKSLETTTHNKNPQSHIKAREVPSHGKISKEDFKKFAGIKVLVAEDNFINQKVIAGLLDGSGIVLEFASDGLEAISYLNNQKDFDIVLMDAHMPNLDGFEATKKIRSHKEFRNIPVVALSGDVAKDDVQKMYDAGMDAHLEKPLKIDALYDIFAMYAEPSSQMELDTQKGIEISGGDISFYKDILREFIQGYGHAHEKVQTLLSNAKLKEADALLLDIVGITANIGAEQLHNDTVALKTSLNNIQTGIYKEAFKKFYLSFKKLLQEIEDYLS